MENKTKSIKEKKIQGENHDNPTSQPDPETLHKTDPQENMQGPISSLLNKSKDKMDEHGGEYVDGEEDDIEEEDLDDEEDVEEFDEELDDDIEEEDDENDEKKR